MRVTMFVRCLAMMRGGGETRHLAWARELTALGVDIEIVTGRPLVGQPRYAIGGLTTTVLRSPYTRDFVYRFQRRRGFGRVTMTALHLDEEWFCRAAWRHVEAQQTPPDVVHAHALHQAARLRRRNVPVVINLPGAPHPRYYRDLAEADALVADGWAATHLPAEIGLPVERVPKGVDTQRFRPDGPSMRRALQLEGKRVVLTVARLVPIKNVALLLDAFAIVRERDGNAHLVIVGDGPEAQNLRARAHALGWSDAVIFAGAVPFDDVPSFYRTADVFALSSTFDNSPNVVLEAMATGLPIVTTEVGGVGEFVTDRRGGVIVPDGDVQGFASALQSVLGDSAFARSAAEFNRQRTAAGFSWRTSAARLLDVYQSVIAKRRGLERVPA
jgi:glycosyltransferase involved in cell wall biosynthesis